MDVDLARLSLRCTLGGDLPTRGLDAIFIDSRAHYNLFKPNSQTMRNEMKDWKLTLSYRS